MHTFTTQTPPAVGTFVQAPFGARAKQIAHVEGYARDGRVKIRAWNAAQGFWMPGTRLVAADDLTSAEGKHIPSLDLTKAKQEAPR